MESTIGLYKTERIKPRRPWRSLAQAELATAELTSGDQARSTMCGLTAEMGFGERRVDRQPKEQGRRRRRGQR